MSIVTCTIASLKLTMCIIRGPRAPGMCPSVVKSTPLYGRLRMAVTTGIRTPTHQFGALMHRIFSKLVVRLSFSVITRNSDNSMKHFLPLIEAYSCFCAQLPGAPPPAPCSPSVVALKIPGPVVGGTSGLIVHLRLGE